MIKKITEARAKELGLILDAKECSDCKFCIECFESRNEQTIENIINVGFECPCSDEEVVRETRRLQELMTNEEFVAYCNNHLVIAEDEPSNVMAIKELEIRTRKCRQDCDGACKNIVNNQCSCIDALSLRALKEVETKKNFYFLKDLDDSSTDAVIIAKTSTAEDISEAIWKAKEKDNYEWCDIVDALPDDCKIYDRWSNNIQNIYY